MALDERGFPDQTLDEIFTYHAPTADQVLRYARIREGAFAFAKVVRDNCPVSADRTDAMRKLREVVMTANASIALEEARR